MSSDQLAAVLRRIIDLLLRCQSTDEANWLKERLDAALTTGGFDWSASRADLHRATIGMGSLGDIYLRPPERAGLDADEANRQLRALNEELWRLTK